MGELAEDFALMREAKQERRNRREPGRIAFVEKQLSNIGYKTEYDGFNKCLIFKHKGNACKIYPFTGWWTGKGIGSDRGVKKLLRKLLEENNGR